MPRQPRSAHKERAWQVHAPQCDPVAYRIAESLLDHSTAAREAGDSERALWLGVCYRAWHDAACMVASRKAQKSETIASVLDRAEARAFFLRHDSDYARARRMVEDLAGVRIEPMAHELRRVIAVEELERNRITGQTWLWTA